MVVGVKIYNNVIVFDNDKFKIEIVFECVKKVGKLMGFVVIFEIIYVIFVVYGVYNVLCKNMVEIVDDYFDD